MELISWEFVYSLGFSFTFLVALAYIAVLDYEVGGILQLAALVLALLAASYLWFIVLPCLIARIVYRVLKYRAHARRAQK